MTSLSSMPFYNLDDDEFRLTLIEFMNGGTINFDPDRLAQLKFNPLLCESYKNFSLCKDNDPDMSFYLENNSCEYYTEDSFKNMLAENQSRLNLKYSTLESSLSFLHMNIRSLNNKFDLDLMPDQEPVTVQAAAVQTPTVIQATAAQEPIATQATPAEASLPSSILTPPPTVPSPTQKRKKLPRIRFQNYLDDIRLLKKRNFN